MDADQLRRDVVRPALRSVMLHSEAAENLIMGTAAQESHLKYVRQLKGPALGLWQMEPNTHDDIWSNFLSFRSDLAAEVLRSIQAIERPDYSRLVWDLRYGAIMARLHYRRVSAPLPDARDIWGMARYYKQYYNSEMGVATIEQFVENYRLVQ